MSSALEIENDTPMSQPLLDISVMIVCRREILPRWDSKATVMEKSSTYDSITPFGIPKCKGGT